MRTISCWLLTSHIKTVWSADSSRKGQQAQTDLGLQLWKKGSRSVRQKCGNVYLSPENRSMISSNLFQCIGCGCLLCLSVVQVGWAQSAAEGVFEKFIQATGA